MMKFGLLFNPYGTKVTNAPQNKFMQTIEIKMPTQAEIMDYCVENFTPPETPQGLERLERIAKRNIIAQRQKDALEKRGFKFNIS